MPKTNTTVLYWISKTIDNRARHVCLIKGVIVFVRYTHLDQSIHTEIKDTLHFIQRDYAVNGSDITTLNHLDEDPYFPKTSPQQSLNWMWLDHLPEQLSKAFKTLKKNHHHQQIAGIFKKGILCTVFVSAAFFLKSAVSYYQAYTHEKDLIQGSKNLPKELLHLPLTTLEKIVFMAENSQDPAFVIATLQEQQDTTFRLEEFHWRALSATQQQLNIAVQHQGGLTQEEQANHLKNLFNKAPTILPFDQYVSLLKEHEDAKNVEELLEQSAKPHYISFDNLNISLNKKGFQTIEVTFSAELDTDIFHYIETLKDHYKNTLVLQEIGVFRGETGVTGKMVFKIFTPHNVATGYSNE